MVKFLLAFPFVGPYLLNVLKHEKESMVPI